MPRVSKQQSSAGCSVERVLSLIDGKWKMSQNRPGADRAGVVEGLRATGDATSLEMADLVDAHGAGRTSRS